MPRHLLSTSNPEGSYEFLTTHLQSQSRPMNLLLTSILSNISRQLEAMEGTQRQQISDNSTDDSFLENENLLVDEPGQVFIEMVSKNFTKLKLGKAFSAMFNLIDSVGNQVFLSEKIRFYLYIKDREKSKNLTEISCVSSSGVIFFRHCKVMHIVDRGVLIVKSENPEIRAFKTNIRVKV